MMAHATSAEIAALPESTGPAAGLSRLLESRNLTGAPVRIVRQGTVVCAGRPATVVVTCIHVDMARITAAVLREKPCAVASAPSRGQGGVWPVLRPGARHP